MIEFSEEFAVDYPHYRFAYCRFCELEQIDELDRAYQAGFLPASSAPFPVTLRFYQARSLRVYLPQLGFNKNRRYQQRLLDADGCTWQVLPKSDALALDQWRHELEGIALQWVALRYQQSYLCAERLQYLLARPFLNFIARASSPQGTLGYALLCGGQSSVHYWFALYRPHDDCRKSTGKWMMGRFLQWAQQSGYTHAYLGTAYGSKARYKSQGIYGCAFFDGKGWNEDLGLLSSLQLKDPA